MSESCLILDVASVARWAGRLIGLGSVGLVALFLIAHVAEGSFNPLQFTGREALELVFLFVTCAGLLLAWWREGIGGTLAVAGMLLFQSVEFIVNGRVFGSWVFVLMLSAGVSLVLSALLRNSQRSGQAHAANSS